LNYYVYYKIEPGRVDEFRLRVEALFSVVEKQTGVRGRWMRRRDDPTTYMEVYEDVKEEAAFEALLEREGAKLGVQRKVERFISAETPA
jgi:quinol monooxygenase YgiN